MISRRPRIGLLVSCAMKRVARIVWCSFQRLRNSGWLGSSKPGRKLRSGHRIDGNRCPVTTRSAASRRSPGRAPNILSTPTSFGALSDDFARKYSRHLIRHNDPSPLKLLEMKMRCCLASPRRPRYRHVSTANRCVGTGGLFPRFIRAAVQAVRPRGILHKPLNLRQLKEALDIF